MTTNKKQDIWFGGALVVLNLIFANMIFDHVTGLRVDLTEGNVFSLSNTTEKILGNLEERVTINAYISKPEMIQESLRPAVPRIRDMLDEYAALGDGMVKVDYIIPEDDAEAEENAQKLYRVRPQLGIIRDERQEGVKSFYLSIVVMYPNTDPVTLNVGQLITQRLVGGEPTIELRNVEFELTKAIKKVVWGFENKRKLFSNFDGKMNVTCFISDEKDLPKSLAAAPKNAKTALESLAAEANGKLTFEFADLSDESKLAAYRVPGIPFPGAEKPIYLWAFAQVGDDLRALPLFSETGVADATEIEELLEAMIKEHTPGLLRTIGVAEHREVVEPRAAAMGQNGPPPPFQAMSMKLSEEHLVRSINLNEVTKISPQIDVLLVMEPAELSEQAAYAIDQYVMSGGRVIFCLDKNSSVPTNPRNLIVSPQKTGLEDVLATWGVKVSDDVLMDKNGGTMFWTLRGKTIDSNWYSLPEPGLEEGEVNRELAFMADLEACRLWYASVLELEDQDGLKSTWALKSSKESWLVPVAMTKSPDFGAHKEGGYPLAKKSEQKQHIVSALVEGKFKSYWRDKAVPGSTTEEGKEPKTAALKESPETRILVISNGDFMHSIQASLAGNGPRFSLFPLNLRWILGTVDWMLEDDDLSSIRNRGRTFRKLGRIDDGEKDQAILANFLVPIGLLGLMGLGLLATRKLSA